MGKRKPSRKFLALALSLALVLTLLPTTAAAAEALVREDVKSKFAEAVGAPVGRQKTPGISLKSAVPSGADLRATAASVTSVTPGHAAVVLTVGDVWGDGTGYQMLLDADANTYGTIIPADNNLSTEGDVPASVYAEFEHKIPINADGSLTTSNIVFDNSIAIEIPAGVYDYCITNPTPEDKMYIAGGALARGNDYTFEDGKTYFFAVVPNGNNDLVTLSVAAAGIPAKVTGLTAVPGPEYALSCELSWTNPSLDLLGVALTSLDAIVIERNGVVVHTIQTPIVGGAEVWTDTLSAAGGYTYTVYAVAAAGAGDPASVSAIVGNLAIMGSPSPVTLPAGGITFTDDGGPDRNYLPYTDENYIQVMAFLPDAPGKLVRATFTEFNTVVDLDADALYVVNGSYADIADIPDSAIVDVLYGDLTSALPITYTSDSADGALTFIFIRDSWGFYSPTAGWQANMDCVTPPALDAGLTAILSPQSAASDSYTVAVGIKNFGSAPITSLTLKYQVDGGSVVAETYMGNLAMLQNAAFTFAVPISLPGHGVYQLRVWAELTGDENAANDALEQTVVYRPAVTLYGYRVYGGELDFTSFQSNAPQTITHENPFQDGSNSMRGGEYFNGELYAFTAPSSGDGNIVKLTDDWNWISSTPTSGRPNDVAYDHATGTMYALAGTNLYTVDTESGAFTTVTGDLPETFLTLACNLSGQLYGIGASGGFYSINKTTGAATLIAQTGYTSRYIHSMAFDHNTGRLFWVYIDYDGTFSKLIEIDPVSGACVELGDLGGTMTEMVMLYSPYVNQNVPEAPTAFTVTPDAGGGLSCALSWTNPSLNVGGTALTELTSLVIRRNGVVVHTINAPVIGAAASWTDSSVPAEGNYVYTIFAINSAGTGLSVSAASVEVGNTGAVNTFPWQVGFEENAFPWLWKQEAVSGTVNWTVAAGNGGYPAAAHSGTYNAVFKNASYTADVTRLVTRSLDLTGLSNPTLNFWHTQIDWAGDQDELRVYYKTSQAGAWVLLAEYTDSITAWTEETIALPNASDDYYIAFEGTAQYGRGIALDDITVQDIADFADVGVLSIDLPASGANLTAAEMVQVTVKNHGTVPVENIPVTLTVNGTVVAAEIIAGPIAKSAELAYTFTATADLSAIGAHEIAVTLSLPGDTNPANDTLSATVQHTPPAAITWDFEQGMPEDFTLRVLDTGTANNTTIFPNNEAWAAWGGGDSVSPIGTLCAASQSWFSSGTGAANRWMITPQITVGAGGASLQWDARCFEAAYPDGYTVKLSVTDMQTESFTETLFSVAAEAGDWTNHVVDLSAYAGQSVYIAFIQDSNDMNILMVDEIKLLGDAQLTGSVPTFTVTFDTDGGTEIASQTVAYGEKAVKPDNPVKEGFAFVGWYADAAFETEFDFDNTLITASITIYAKWASISHAVRAGIRSVNGGEVGDTLSYILSLENLNRVMNIRIRFEVNGNMLSGNGLELLRSDFSAMNGGDGIIRWTPKGDGIYEGEFLLMYLGGPNGLTSEEAIDVAELLFTALQYGGATVTLTDLLVTGLDEDGNGVTLDSAITQAMATAIVAKVYSKYDLNKDGVIDQRDLSMAQRYYMVGEGDANWAAAKACDFNGDGLVDMLDLVDLFVHFT